MLDLRPTPSDLEATMPQAANKKWGEDSFMQDDYCHKGRSVHGAGDAHLSGEVLNPSDYHRPMGEQYGTTTFNPGAANSRTEHRTKNIAGKGPRVDSEYWGTVVQRSASLKPGSIPHGDAVGSEQFDARTWPNGKRPGRPDATGRVNSESHARVTNKP